MGLIGTRSLTRKSPASTTSSKEAEDPHPLGIIAYDALRPSASSARDETPADARATFEKHSADLGFAFLLLRYVDDPRRRPTSRSPRRPTTPYRPSGRCSGRSGSWWRSASPSSR
jgi:hypothetical protein